MKVILIKNVPKKGKVNDIIEVSDGYGKNFLIKQGLALPVNDKTLTQLNKTLSVNQARKEEEMKELTLFKKQLEDITLNFKLQENKGKTFGSISLTQIADRLEKEYNLNIDKKKFYQANNLTDVGLHYLTIKLGHDITATLKVMVDKKEN